MLRLNFPLLDAATRDRIAEAAKSISKVTEQWARNCPQLTESVLTQHMHLAAQMAEVLEPIRERLEPLNRLLEEYEPVLRRAADEWARLPEGTRLAQDMAAASGWYLSLWDLSLDDASRVATYGRSGDSEGLAKWMCLRTKRDYDCVRSEVLSSFSNRSAILVQAFNAHERGQFALSIPVMLAQADGIHLDLVGQFLFKRLNHRKLKASLPREISESDQEYAASLLFLMYRPLLQFNRIAEPTSQRDRRLEEADIYQNGTLNRHGVLHGIDLDYATEENSYRALSLLEFLGHIKKDLETIAT